MTWADNGRWSRRLETTDPDLRRSVSCSLEIQHIKQTIYGE